MTSCKNLIHSSLSLLMAPLFAGPSLLASEGGFRVGSFLGTGANADTVVIDGGQAEGVASGDVFRVYRPTGRSTRDIGVTVETGEAKALMVYEHKTIAQITQQSTPLSREVFPNFAEVMAGDIAVKQRLEIKQALALSPEVAFTYSRIFEDPNSNPQNFELTAMGRELISMGSVELGKMKSGLLMVIGHTDAKGLAELNQVESYQRAAVVRQYLIDQLGFDADRVVAIGKGEDELPEESLTPGYIERARRVVVKVVPDSQG